MGSFDFLKSLQITEAPVKTPSTRGVSKQWNPDPATLAIRLWYSGAIFPSSALVNKFDLHYKRATVTKEVKAAKEEGGKETILRSYAYPDGAGNAFDVVSSKEWASTGQYQPNPDHPAFIALAIVPKTTPKADLFAAVRYDEEGNPISNVFDQGATTFGKDNLLPMLEDIYGIKLSNEEGGREFVDLVLDDSFDLAQLVSNGIFLIPKKVTRGKDEGKLDYERRENVSMFVISPADEVVGSNEEPTDAQPLEEVVEA